MTEKSGLSRFLPGFLRKKKPLVHVVRLQGVIGMAGPMRQSLNAKDIEPLLERAFKKNVSAVVLQINSPGGSPVQSALIQTRVRALAQEFKLPVYAFCEDVAASGGYWLACAADEIYADQSSIVGSIGVISAGFGFTEAIAKLGIERRVYTSGESKSILDPFEPEKPEDVARLKALQNDIHQHFKTLVRSSRKERLKGDEAELFSGAFWTGDKALEFGLIDGLGEMYGVMKAKLGDKTRFKTITASSGWGLKRLAFGTIKDLPLATIEALESRSLWSRFGL